MSASYAQPELAVLSLEFRPGTSRTQVWKEAHADAKAFGHRVELARLLGGAMGVTDVLLVCAGAAMAHLLRHGLHPIPMEIASITALAAIVLANTLYFSGAYSAGSTDRLSRQIATVVRVWTLIFVGLVLLGYMTKTSGTFSRAWAFAWYGIVLALLIAARSVAAAQVKRWRAQGRFATTVAIVDLCGRGDAVARQLRRVPAADVHLAGVFQVADAGNADAIAELLDLSRLFRIDEVLVIASPHSEADVVGILRRLAVMTSNIRLCPSMPDLGAMAITGGNPVVSLPAMIVHRAPLSGWKCVQKRAEDLVIGSAALLVLWPLMLLIAICIRLESPGPALFRQARQGFNNNVFTVFKFRTMTHRIEPEKDVPQATRHDPRVTRIGRFLRRTSLDELPQLLNVILGQMSLVGPRPHAVAHNEMYGALIDDYIRRHRVRPGITGWAQVNGLRGETDTLEKMEARVRYDLAYIDRWSFLFDLQIIVMTAATALFDRRAY